MTADFITPVVDNPYLYGQIAAANSLSDVYAMGGEVKCALNLLMWDKCHITKEMMREILEGGISKIKEADGFLLGGHTIADEEQKYGLSVTGLICPQKIWKNNTAQKGDILILTKPLGIGVLTTALKAGMLSPLMQEQISTSMAFLNKYATQIAKDFSIHACTDVTGFGLLGHLYEMINPKISIKINSCNLPIFKEAFEFANMGIIPGGSYSNQKAIEDFCHFNLPPNSPYQNLEILLFDAQTSGGLLLALPQEEAPKLLERLINEGLEHSKIIGEVIKREDKPLLIT